MGTVIRMRVIAEALRRLPVIADVDVAVVGGGMAGFAAACTAARAGAKTLLIERFGFSGGLATGGLINVFWVLDDGDGHAVIGELSREILRRLDRMGALWIKPIWRGGHSARRRRGIRNAPWFDPETLKLVCDRLLTASGAGILYHAHAGQPIVRGQTIRAIPVETKSGRKAVVARVFIDATGDADLATACGAPCVERRNEQMTAWFRAAGDAFQPRQDSLDFLRLAPIIESGEHTAPAERKAPDFDSLTSEGLSGWEIAAREMIFRKLAVMRKRLGGRVWAVAMPTHPNVRKTRRIVGAYALGRKDNLRRFEDAVGRQGFWVVPGEVYEIPYRCLLPKGVENLLVAGRCVSTTEDGWDITRILSGCVLTGEAAGAAAALAARDRLAAADVDAVQIRRLMASP